MAQPARGGGRGHLLIGIAFVIVALRLLDEVRLPFAPEADKPALGVVGFLFLISGAGVLFRQRWAMFLGLPLLVLAAAFAVVQLVEQAAQGTQPGSFAVIGVPMFAAVAALCAFAFVKLFRTAVPRR